MTTHQWHGRDLDRSVPQTHESHPEAREIYQTDTFKMNNLHGGSSFHSSEHSPSDRYVKDYGMSAQSTSPTQNQRENEVDYYDNPTELFRWINYRKWGGAWARVQSNPEECSTWVVSRHSSDGRILWKHLPLHLVCMQSGLPVGANASIQDESRDAVDSIHPNIMDADAANQIRSTHYQQLERLAEEILFTYPNAAKAQDDQGMIPLHQCINSSNATTCINERIFMMLLIVNPTGLKTRDRNGRTALEMIMERRTSVPGIESILRITNNAFCMMDSISDSAHDDASKELEELRQQSENERQASQRIIVRLENELADEHRRANKENSSLGEMKMQSSAMQGELNRLKKTYESLELDLDQVRRERDELIASNKSLTEEVDKQEGVVAEIRRQAEMDCAEQNRTISTLKSEANTARAMVDAVENQLRNKFNNEQDLNTSVDVLEKKVAILTTTYQKEKKNLHNEIERLKEEKKMKETSIAEFMKKNEVLQVRNNDLNKNIEDVLFSHSALAAEYDKLLDSSKRYESRVLESFQLEQENLLCSIDKQKKVFESVMEEQKQIIKDSHEKEIQLTNLINNERKKQYESFDKIKVDYQKIRAHITSHHINVPKRDVTMSRSRAPSTAQSSNDTSNNNSVFIDKSNTFNSKQQLNAPSQALNSRPQKSDHDIQPQNNHRPAHLQDDRTQSSTQKSTNPSTQRSMQQPMNHVSEEISSSKGLIEYLEEKSRQRSNVRNSPASSSSYSSNHSFNNHSSMKTPNISINTNRSTEFYTPTRPREINQSMEVNHNELTPQKSFSLDEFSDMDSRQSTCTDSMSNDYAGMTSAIKKGVIRVNPKPSVPPGRGAGINIYSSRNKPPDHKPKSSVGSVHQSFEPNSMESIREKYSKRRNKYAVKEEGSINTEDYGFSVSSASDILPLGNLKGSKF